MKPIKLSIKERLSYVLQLRTLQKLSDDEYEKKEYENLIVALLHGYTLHYNDLFGEFYEDEMSEEDSRYVLDILEMYRGIIYSYIDLQRNGAQLTLKEDDVLFPGFDGNDDRECSLMGYARYFVCDLGRYDEIKNRTMDDFNSHMPTTQLYDRMLSIWRSKDRIHRYKMSETEIKELLNP